MTGFWDVGSETKRRMTNLTILAPTDLTETRRIVRRGVTLALRKESDRWAPELWLESDPAGRRPIAAWVDAGTGFAPVFQELTIDERTSTALLVGHRAGGHDSIAITLREGDREIAVSFDCACRATGRSDRDAVRSESCFLAMDLPITDLTLASETELAWATRSPVGSIEVHADPAHSRLRVAEQGKLASVFECRAIAAPSERTKRLRFDWTWRPPDA